MTQLACRQAPATVRIQPRLQLLGPVALLGTHGVVEPGKRSRLIELAAYPALNAGASRFSLDAAMWPGVRETTNTRNTLISKLRRWLGTDAAGECWMPPHSGYTLGRVDSDWADWQRLVPGPASAATTERLEQALQLVTGRPFEGTPSRRYAWAEPAAAIGINVDMTREAPWRARIIAARSSGNAVAEREAIARMRAVLAGGGFTFDAETVRLLESRPTRPRCACSDECNLSPPPGWPGAFGRRDGLLARFG